MVCMINMLIFIFIITVFYFFIFCSLIARDKYLLFYKRVILSFEYHKLIFLSVVFSLRTKRVTSQHNLEEDERDNLQNKLESPSQKHK